MATPKAVADRISRYDPEAVLVEFSNEQDVIYVNFHISEEDWWEEKFHFFLGESDYQESGLVCAEDFTYKIVDYLKDRGLDVDFENLDTIYEELAK